MKIQPSSSCKLKPCFLASSLRRSFSQWNREKHPTNNLNRILTASGTPARLGSIEGDPSKIVRRIDKGFSLPQDVESKMKMLNHPNVDRMTILCKDGFQYFISERIPFSVIDYCQRHSEFENLNIQYCLLSLASGVEYIHSQGMCHGGLKPSNVRFTKGGDVKIVDVGFNLLTDAFSPNRSLPSGIPNQFPELNFRSELYEAPEFQEVQIIHRNPESDVFSLGILFYLLATRGDHPFAFDLQNLFNGLSTLDGLTSNPKLKLLINGMIAHDPVKRPSMQTVRQRLEKLFNIDSGLRFWSRPDGLESFVNFTLNSIPDVIDVD